MTVQEPSPRGDAEAGLLRTELRRGSSVVAALSGLALALLSVLVAVDATTGLDDAARQLFRPNDHWGDLQVRVDAVVEGLRPVITASLLAGTAALLAARRRSWWPLACVGVVYGAGATVTVALKVLVGRHDTHGDLGALGGSYPSGHVMTVLVAAGCLALMVRRRPAPWAWALAAVAAAVMGWSLLVQTAHWLTDVVGGLLVGTLVLAAASRLAVTGPTASPRATARTPVGPGPPTRR